MGKRELIIAAAFVVAGALLYQLTAPAPNAGERSFSLRDMFSGIRREVLANAASASVTREGTLAIRPGVTEIRLAAARVVPLTVIGERRADIAYELSVESTGPDAATAKNYAERVAIVDDDLGESQQLRLKFPEEGQQTGTLTLRIPERLRLRLENAGRVNISGVGGVELRNLGGEVVLAGIAGIVKGGHRAGDLTISKAAGVHLTLASSRARLAEIAGPITLTARGGTCLVTASTGAIEADMTNVEFEIADHAGPIKVTGETGLLRVTRPRKEIVVDVRRMEVEVTMAASIPARLMTTNEPLRLILDGPPDLSIDAVNDGGAIRAADFSLQPTLDGTASRLKASLAGGGSRVVLRNARADIVISRRK